MTIAGYFDKAAICFTQIRGFVIAINALNHEIRARVCHGCVISSTRRTNDYRDNFLQWCGLSSKLYLLNYFDPRKAEWSDGETFCCCQTIDSQSSDSISFFSTLPARPSVHFKWIPKISTSVDSGRRDRCKTTTESFLRFLGFLPSASFVNILRKFPVLTFSGPGRCYRAPTVRLFVAFVSPTRIYQKKRRQGRSQKVSGEKTLINKWKMNSAFFREFWSVESPQPSSGNLNSLISFIIRFDFPRKILNFPSPC